MHLNIISIIASELGGLIDREEAIFLIGTVLGDYCGNKLLCVSGVARELASNPEKYVPAIEGASKAAPNVNELGEAGRAVVFALKALEPGTEERKKLIEEMKSLLGKIVSLLEREIVISTSSIPLPFM